MAKIEKGSMTQSVNGVVTRAPKDEDSELGSNFKWWTAKDDDQMAEQIGSTIRFIKRHQSDRMEMLTVGSRLYGNSTNSNLFSASFTRASSINSNPMSQRISYNLCASVIDTLTSQIAKNKVLPTFITSGGVWGMQKKGEQLSKFIDGKFYEQKVHEKKVYAFRDAAIWGDGIVYTFRDAKDRAAVERVLPQELFVDITESAVTEPQQIHRVKICDRDKVCAQFPEHAELIKAANPVAPEDIGSSKTAADLIGVGASWHLRSGPDCDDGIFAITLLDNGKILHKEPWEYDYFPFDKIMYAKRQLGYWSQGACERLQNLQGEINRLMILIQKSMWMGGSFKILSHVLDKVPTSHFNNEVAPIIKWSGEVPPQYIAPPMIQQDIYPYVDTLIQKGYQQEGVSMLGAASVKPAGVNSAVALRTYDEIADDRQLFIQQQIEQFELSIARKMIDIVKKVAKEKGTYKVKFPNANFIESIDWADIHLEEDEYYLKAYPTSELPTEPMARLQTIQEYAQAGWISPQAARRLMRTEDLEMSDTLANAAESLICKSIEEILYDGKKANDVRPNSRWNLPLAKQLSLQYYNFAVLNNCPEARLREFDNFMAYLDDEMGLTTPPAPPPMAAAPANPQQTPQSDLLPNVNGAA